MLKRSLFQQLHQLVQWPLVRTTTTRARKPPISQKVRFIDQLRITVRGGHGGGGSSALFGRTGHHPRAAGGNGAAGGAVILQGSKHLTGLGTIPLHVEAERGGGGGKQWRDGKKGADKVVHVPLGTLVYQLVEIQPRAGREKVHGVTALPHQIAAMAATSQPGCFAVESQQQQGPQQQQVRSAESGRMQQHSITQQQQQQQDLHVNQTGDVDPARSTIHISKRLFPDTLQQPAAQNISIGRDTLVPQQPISSIATMTDHYPHIAQQAAEGSDVQAAAAAPDAATNLYQQLLDCDRMLSNTEKLHLLHTGSLQGYLQQNAAEPSVLPAYSAWDAADCFSSSSSSTGSVHDHSDDNVKINRFVSVMSDHHDHHVVPGSVRDSDEGWWGESDDDADEGDCDQESDQDIWVGEGGDIATQRSFSKQQVWSILESQAVLLGELTDDGQQLVVAAGGLGGRGNAAAHSRHNAPASRARSDGTPGQEVMLLLKLRLLADVVLVGLPNVGKSSLITALTNANAQVGSYAFTTLRPQLGTMVDAEPYTEADAQDTAHAGQDSSTVDQLHHNSAAGHDFVNAEEPSTSSVQSAAAVANNGTSVDGSSRVVIADLPGLLPGAHAGRGRGTAFLAHLQKARCLALVVDVTGGDAGEQQIPGAQGQGDECEEGVEACAGVERDSWKGLVSNTPQQQLSILQEELTSYDPSILSMPMLVVANKLDALSADAGAAALKQLKSVTQLPIIPVSAEQGAGLQRLKSALQLLVKAR